MITATESPEAVSPIKIDVEADLFGRAKDRVKLTDFHTLYESGIAAQVRVELALRKPYEKVSKDEWNGAVSEILSKDEQKALGFYRKIRDFHENYFSAADKMFAVAIDWSKYVNTRIALNDNYIDIVDIYVKPVCKSGWSMITDSDKIERSESVIEHVPFPAHGYPLAHRKTDDGKLVIYDEELAGFASRTTGDREEAVKSQARFYEQLIEDVQEGGSRKIDPKSYAHKEVSMQFKGDSGQKITCAYLLIGINGPRLLDAGGGMTEFINTLHFSE